MPASRLLAAFAVVALPAAGLAAPPPVSFAREVVPILTRAGCNQGACHGTPTGKGGFRLSLRGYDPAPDFAALTRELGGRRIDRVAPDRSLILEKATARAAHEGGKRLEPGGGSYRLLRDWVAQGAADDPDPAPPVRLEVTPARAVVDAPADSQQVRVVAHFAGGAARDVTHLARLAVNDDAVARPDPDGTVRKLKAGEVAVAAEYMGLMRTAVFLFRDPAPGFRWPDPPEANFIDTHAFAKLKLLRIEPSALSTDEEFLRRAHLDAVGRLPTPAEVRAFLADTSPGKRAAKIDELLVRPEFADWWGMKWADRLGINQRFVGKIGAVKYHQWVRAQIAANVPEDEFVRQILTAGGPNYSDPAAGFWRRLRTPDARAEEVAQLFMGVRMGCAKCHNHPGESWTQDDYYGLAAFFSRVQYRDGPFFIQKYDKEETVLVARDGEVTHPRTGRAVPPKFPGGPEPALSDEADRRAAFAGWLTGPGNPFFAPAGANRVWYHLFGRGLVDPVDDFRGTNPAGNEALLDALAADFATHGFDRKHLIRTVMTSRTYQLSARKTATNGEDVKYFSRCVPRRLPAEAILDAIGDATGVPEAFPGFPAGTPAARIPDGDFKHPFLVAFGRPARAMACECERGGESNLGQALHLVGGLSFQAKLADPGGRAARLAAAPDAAAVEELFLATLSRYPTSQEKDLALRHLAAQPGGGRRAAVEDLLHALLNHPEFLFQH